MNYQTNQKAAAIPMLVLGLLGLLGIITAIQQRGSFTKIEIFMYANLLFVDLYLIIRGIYLILKFKNQPILYNKKFGYFFVIIGTIILLPFIKSIIYQESLQIYIHRKITSHILPITIRLFSALLFIIFGIILIRGKKE